MIGWWSSNPITETIVKLDYVLLLCYKYYNESLALSSCPLSPPALPLFSPFPSPCPLPPAPTFLHFSSQCRLSPTTSDKPRPPASAPTSCRGLESVTSQYIEKNCYASWGCRHWYYRNSPPPLLLPGVDIPSPAPTVASYFFLWSARQPCPENSPGPVQCRGSAPRYPTRKSITYVFCSHPLAIPLLPLVTLGGALAHWAVARLWLLSATQGTIILHQGHSGWRRFTSSKIITVSQTWQWKEWTRIAVRVAAHPRHPSAGQFLGSSMIGKAILYVHGYPPWSVVPQCQLPPVAFPCCVCR